jgi:hypothetical protein
MVYMLCMFRSVQLDQEVRCLMVLGFVVYIPSGTVIMVNMTMDLMTMTLCLTLLADYRDQDT